MFPRILRPPAKSFFLFGPRGTGKRTSRIRSDDLRGLRAFLDDYPMARAYLVYTGPRRYHDGAVEIVPLGEFLTELRERL
jgi:hypothetical protein